MSDLAIADTSWNPFVWAASALPGAKREDHRDASRHDKYAKKVQETATMMQTVHRATPTPENTGAPVPGYLKRGPINPSTTGAPVPGTLKTQTAIHPITGEKVTPVPVKPRGKKPTAPGTKPKK
jgi:hypothetical protein